MIIDIAKVPLSGGPYDGEEPGEILGVEGDAQVEAIREPVRFNLFVQIVSGELICRGTVSAKLEMACSRCGEIFSTSVTDSSFLRAYEIAESEESVDITPDLRESILLNLSSFPLCNAECAGLCSMCGTNLNRSHCDCVPTTDSSKWGALDALTLDE